MAEKEYIERVSLIRFVKQNTPNIQGDTTMRCVQRTLKAAPAASDVVKVVRCEKCKFFFEDCCNHPENRIAYRVPDFGDHYVYAGRIKCEPDHFCGRGERKEQT